MSRARGAAVLVAVLASGVALAAPRADAALRPRSEPRAATLARGPLTGRVVLLDPGHNAHNGAISPSCNTTGTSTNDGYPEHAHTWDVVQRTATRLRALGARVVLTRPDDDGVGPCVVDRGRLAGAVRADVLVSVHDDGAPVRLRGFHVVWDDAPLHAAVGTANRRLAVALRDAVEKGTGLPRATYVGTGGLCERSDLHTLAESIRPAALVELGNMRNPVDARLLRSPAFRDREADSLVAGIRAFLGR